MRAERIRRWFPAWFAATRYIVYNMALAYSGWLVAVKDQWSELSSWDHQNVAIIVLLAALTALGAVMNGTWQAAKAEA
jgi:hypothetical protein